jgi:hypothetical protein
MIVDSSVASQVSIVVSPLAVVPPFAEIVFDQDLVGLATAFLLVSVLLYLFNSRAEEERPLPVRRSPVSIEELGRAVFEAAVRADLDGYRELFLAGGEARDAFGDQAQHYLERRALPVLEEALVTLGALIPEGSRFGGAEATGSMTVAIRVLPPGAQPILVAIGSVTRVGGVFRIQEPTG